MAAAARRRAKRLPSGPTEPPVSCLWTVVRWRGIEERLDCRWAWFDLGVSVGYYGWDGGFVSEGGEIFSEGRQSGTGCVHAYSERRILTSRTAFGMTGIFL